MSKVVLILGANTLQIPLIKKANEIGYQTLVVSPKISEPGHRIATYSEKCDVIDEERVLSLAKLYNICGIITDQTDLPVRTMAYVANKLGLPGNSYDVAQIFTDKYLMREKCKEIGVKCVEYKLCHSIEEAESFYKSINCDVIIKPVDNQGSKGVSKVSSIKELQSKFEEAIKYSRSSGVLIEKFINGKEFLVEGICVDYEYKNLCCGDTECFDIPDVFSACKREFPSMAPKGIVERVLSINEIICRGFGIKQGMTHAEYILDGNEPILLEIAARGGGVFISSDLINIQTGIQTEEFLLGIATGEINKLPDFTLQNKSCCYISFFLPEGRIINVEGVNSVISLPYTHHNNFELLTIGKNIKKNKDKTTRFYIIIEAKDHDELLQRCEYIKRSLRVDVLGEDGIIRGIIWK